MTFKDIIGQSFLKTKLIQDVDSGRVPHAQLFVGKRGVGGMPMAIAYADYLTNQQSDGLGDVNPLTHPNIHFVYPVTTSEKVKSKLSNSTYGEIYLLENLRFYKEETNGDLSFAKELASLADVYINDAFGTSHRAHASTYGVAQFFKGNKYCGLLLEKEISSLNSVFKTTVSKTISWN